jgi:hypothetical protein
LSAIDIFAQKLPVKESARENNMVVVEEKVPAVIKIYPVPVLEGRFTITSDKPFIYIRMTNIIGQEITSERFYYPRSRSEVSFPNAEKGIYLITIELEDNSKVVKKILVDTSR